MRVCFHLGLKEILVGAKILMNRSLVRCLQEQDYFDSGHHGLQLGFARRRRARVIKLR
jgi:hypothetical protein